MIVPIQSAPTIRKRKLNTGKISGKMAGLISSQFMEEDDEYLQGIENMDDMDDMDDIASMEAMESIDDFNY